MYCSSMYRPLKQVIVKSPADAFRSQAYLKEQWQVYNYMSEPDLAEANREFSEFIDILKGYVDQIHYLPASEKVGLDSIYAHDPVKFTPHGAIILKSGKQSRQTESQEMKAFLQRQNIPIIGELTGEAVADGGDIVWIDDETLAVGRGYRTNDEAIRQLRELTASIVSNFIVVPLPHDLGEQECLHLMSFISIVDEKLAVVHSRLMPVFFRQFLLEKGFQLIEVSQEEYDRLGCNVLAVAPRVCVMLEGCDETAQALRDHGATVHLYKGDEISWKGTGGPTCLTCPVQRMSL